MHEGVKRNPLGVIGDRLKVPFHQYFTVKDLVALVLYLGLIRVFVFFYPNIIRDPENFSVADPLVTPAHIKPEFYFIWAYAILRSVPSKLGGVVAILLGVLALLLLPILNKRLPGCCFCPVRQVLFWTWVSNFMFLSYIGACPVEFPYD